MLKLLSLLAFLLLANDVRGLDRARDCKCRLPSQPKIVDGKFARVHYPWSATFFEKNVMPGNSFMNFEVLENAVTRSTITNR